MLRIDGINSYYGTHHVLRDVSLRVGDRELVTVIGANGAGKTTLLRTISGFVRPAKGNIDYNGKNICQMTPPNIVRIGICQVPEGRQLFSVMTVKENLVLGAYQRSDKENIAKDMDWICALFPILREKRKQRAEALSGGQQQILAIARGLMSNPNLLLLDEPSWGLSPLLVQTVADIIAELTSRIGVLLVEQDASIALQISDYGYVLELGRIVLKGSAEELSCNESVRESYLGI